MELSTERQSGMGTGSIPVSKVWDYIDRFNLPDWFEPIILQADAILVSAINSESDSASTSTKPTNRKAVA